MQNISSAIDLKEAIRVLEMEQAEKGQLLREKFHLTFESLKPASFLKSTILSSSLIDNILGTTMGLATGYISKKIVIGGSANIFRKLLGTIMQIGVSNIVTQHPEAIKSIGKFILQYIMLKKQKESNNQ